MGAELARKRSGKKTQTGMSEKQLGDFAGSVGSLEDIEAMEGYAERKTVMDGETSAHPIHKGYDDCVYGNDRGWKEDGDEPKGSEMSANRDNGFGIHYGAPVDYFGPDTNYRAEEINVHQYGRDYDSFPYRDYFKDQKKGERPNLRLLEEFEYSDNHTPGSVEEKNPGTEAHGAINYRKIPVEIDDQRAFEDQERYRRAQGFPDEDRVDTGGLDTKHGKNIR